MDPSHIEKHIDKKIAESLSRGMTLLEIKYELESNIKIFKKRENYIKVSMRYLINNWRFIHIGKRFTTYYVMFSNKRKNDIEWVNKNKNKFKKFNDIELFGLIKLKDKLNNFEFIAPKLLLPAPNEIKEKIKEFD